MARLFILVKRKKAKKPLGLLPTRRGLSKKQVLKIAKKQIKKGLTFRILTITQVRKMFSGLLNKA